MAIHGTDKILSGYKIYAAHNDVIPLKFEKPADLIAYYPYIVAMMYGDNKKGCGIIQLSERSFIDIEEEDHLNWKMDAVKAVYRRCKRKKKPFDRKAAAEAVSYWNEGMTKCDEEIINRVEKFGERATVEGIHDAWHDRLRQKWYELMIANGWDESTAYQWVFGWVRYLIRVKEMEQDFNGN